MNLKLKAKIYSGRVKQYNCIGYIETYPATESELIKEQAFIAGWTQCEMTKQPEETDPVELSFSWKERP